MKTALIISIVPFPALGAVKGAAGLVEKSFPGRALSGDEVLQ